MELSMIPAQSVFQYIILQFLIYFPTGFFILHNRLKSYPFLICLPIYISAGLFVQMIILSIIGIFYIGNIAYISVPVFFYGIIFLTYTDNFSFSASIDRIKHLLRKPRIIHILTFSVIVITISSFSLLGGYMKWPIGHDSISHGFLTSILTHNHKLQTNLAPIAPSHSWFEPFGLHLMASNLSLLIGLFPGESLLVFSTTLLVLIILLAYSFVYMMTRSIAFAILAATSVLYFFPALNLEYSLMGIFYLGAHAALFGNLGLLLFLTFISIFKEPLQSIKSTLLIGISMVGIGITYTPFVIIPLIALIILEIKPIGHKIKTIFLFLGKSPIDRRNNSKHDYRDSDFFFLSSYQSLTKTVKANGKLIFSIIVISGTLSIPIISMTNISNEVTMMVKRLEEYASWYQLPLEKLAADIPTLCVIFVTIILAVDSLIRRERVRMSVFYLLYASIELLAIRETASYYLFWIFYPSRLFPFLVLFTWIALTIYTHDRFSMIDRFMQKKINPDSDKYRGIFKKILLRLPRPILATTLILIYFSTPIIYNMTFEHARFWGYPSSELENSYKLLTWISQNTNSSSPIMTDYSWPSLFLNSFSLKNVTSTYWPSTFEDFARARESQIAWSRPELLRDFINKYDIEYVLLTSSPLVFNPTVIGGDSLFYFNNITPNAYQNIFKDLPFLKKVREDPSGGAIYKVVINNT